MNCNSVNRMVNFLTKARTQGACFIVTVPMVVAKKIGMKKNHHYKFKFLGEIEL